MNTVLCNPEAKSKVPDWGIKPTLANTVAHGKCVGVVSGVDLLQLTPVFLWIRPLGNCHCEGQGHQINSLNGDGFKTFNFKAYKESNLTITLFSQNSSWVTKYSKLMLISDFKPVEGTAKKISKKLKSQELRQTV